MQTDILIAGSGCAGLYCALNLPKNKNICLHFFLLMCYMDLNCHIFSTLPLSIAQTYRTDKTVVNTYEENL